MKFIIIPIVVILVFSVFKWLFSSEDSSENSLGNVTDIGPLVEGLMNSSEEHPFLIIAKLGTEDFIQFTPGTNGVQLDFPLITERQKECEEKFIAVAEEMNLNVEKDKGSDESNFLDINLNGTPSELTEIIATFLNKFLNVTPLTELEFSYVM